jgi:hypothetical protein
MDVRFGLWNERSFYRVGSPMTIWRELSKYKLNLVGEQEVRWEGGAQNLRENTHYKLLDQRKQAKLQCLQDASEINGYSLNSVRCEASRYFRNKRREYLKDKIKEFATNSMNKNIRDLLRGINEFKRAYQPRNNIVKDEIGDLLADSQNILNRWKKVIECA